MNEIKKRMDAMVIHNPKETDQKILDMDHNPVNEGAQCVPDHNIVIQFMKTLIMLQKEIV